MSVTETKSAVWSARDWAQAILPYRRASAARGVFELAVTFPPFVAIWTAMMIAATHGQFWLSFALAPLAAGLLIRLFLIQHDCGHGSFLPSKLANDWVGRTIGVLTMTPYDHWRRCHAIHHATSGNLDRRGIGDIKTLTVREYFARNWRDRLALPALSPSASDVRAGPSLCVPVGEPAAARLHAQRVHALAQHDDHQRGNPACAPVS